MEVDASKRQEIAVALRELSAYPGNASMYMEAFMSDLRQTIDPFGMSNSYADLYDILADLIEPSGADELAEKEES